MLKTLLSHSVPEISVHQAAATRENIILLDAREHDEFALSHLEGAHFVGYHNFTIDSVKSFNKNAQILVYCSVGYRSEKVAYKLKSEGFKNVSNLYGGIFEWVNQGHPIVDSAGKRTKRIHGYTKAWGIWLNKGEKVFTNE
ncbi:MAG TPA: rhodanese-like domain-containing protein [Chryseolinea sp.]|nr:rhodanese-like domain-containing protein [Chryseolinea sp.]